MTENMLIQILTSNPKEIVNLMSDNQGNVKQRISIAECASIECNVPIYLTKTFVGVPEIYDFAVNFSNGVAIGLFSNWLYEKLKGKSIVLRIEREEVEIKKGAKEIERVIREKIEIRKE